MSLRHDAVILCPVINGNTTQMLYYAIGHSDEIVGYLRSTSVCSEGALGDLFPNFEAGLKEALRPAEGRLFHEWLRCGFTMGRKQTDPHPLDFALRQD